MANFRDSIIDDVSALVEDTAGGTNAQQAYDGEFSPISE